MLAVWLTLLALVSIPKGPPHERSTSEIFNSNAFVLEPSRQLFFDMLAKVGAIDSIELVDNVTVNTDRMFLTGYFDSWSLIPNSQVKPSYLNGTAEQVT